MTRHRASPREATPREPLLYVAETDRDAEALAAADVPVCLRREIESSPASGPPERRDAPAAV